MTTTTEEMKRIAARFSTVRETPSKEPIKHWNRVRAAMQAGPVTYKGIAVALGISWHHANTLLARLRDAGLIEVDTRCVRGKQQRATVYRLPGGAGE